MPAKRERTRKPEPRNKIPSDVSRRRKLPVPPKRGISPFPSGRSIFFVVCTSRRSCAHACRTRLQQVLKKCVIDQFVYAPFSITSFVGYAAVLNGGGPANILANTKSSLADHGLETWIMDWKVWPAANVIMFR